MHIQEEYNAYIKAQEALRNKIYSYLDKLHMRMHMELVLDRTEEVEVLVFVEIKDGLLITDGGEQYSYAGFSTGELLEVYEKLYNHGGI